MRTVPQYVFYTDLCSYVETATFSVENIILLCIALSSTNTSEHQQNMNKTHLGEDDAQHLITGPMEEGDVDEVVEMATRTFLDYEPICNHLKLTFAGFGESFLRPWLCSVFHQRLCLVIRDKLKNDAIVAVTLNEELPLTTPEQVSCSIRRSKFIGLQCTQLCV